MFPPTEGISYVWLHNYLAYWDNAGPMTAEPLDFDVAVVGAGPTGLTICNLLAAAGVRTLLVERNPTTVQQRPAVSIDDETLRTMQATGLLPEVLKDVALDYGLHYLTPNGVCFLRVEPRTREYGYPRHNAFHPPSLGATLRTGLERFDCVTALFETLCESVEEQSDHVTLRVVAQDGGTRTVRVGYLVGSDGGRSSIRKAIGATLGGSTYDQRWLVVDMTDTTEMFRQTRVMCDPFRPGICLPGPHGTRRYEFLLHDNETEEIAKSDAVIGFLLKQFGPDRYATRVREQVYKYHARIVDRWSTDRIFLAGDAAHLSPPFAGQGLNSAMRDAHNLAWKLIAVAKGTLGPKLLRSYEDERPKHAWALIQLAVQLGRIMMPRSRLEAWLVQTGFRLARRLPRVEAYFAEMKYMPRPVYENGFFLPGRTCDIVGRMAPQPLLEVRDGSLQLMDDVIGGGFAVIAYGPEALALANAARNEDFGINDAVTLAVTPYDWNLDPAIQGVLAGRDVEKRFAGLAPPNETIMLLLRPDRYVAAAQIVAGADDLSTFATHVRGLAHATWDAPAKLPA